MSQTPLVISSGEMLMVMDAGLLTDCHVIHSHHRPLLKENSPVLPCGSDIEWNCPCLCSQALHEHRHMFCRVPLLAGSWLQALQNLGICTTASNTSHPVCKLHWNFLSRYVVTSQPGWISGPLPVARSTVVSL